ncbi:Sodium:neurotransmitter symporter family protein, partial [Teladorsagia circumcincta]
AFLIPYVISLVFCGAPLFILETTWGQLLSVGGLGMFKICPIFKVLTADHLLEYKKQFFVGPKVNFTVCTARDLSVQSPVKEFWNFKVLGISDGIDHPGSLRYDLALYLFIAWVICYLCIFKGVRWTGKVVYLTASFPYIMLFFLLVRGLTLPGASLGLEFYLKPDFSKLLESKVWVDAVTQVFFSYGLGLGALVALGRTGVMCLGPAIGRWARVANSLQYLLFMVPYKKDYRQALTVAQAGPGLLFLAYPSGILQLPYTNVWSMLFFSMVLFLGIDSQFCTMEGFFTAIIDEFPIMLRASKYGREIFVGVICLISYIIGLSTVTQKGQKPALYYVPKENVDNKKTTVIGYAMHLTFVKHHAVI